MRDTQDYTVGLRSSAQRLVEARLRQEGFPFFPGEMPRDLDTAYALQTIATDAWPDTVAGWKVGRIVGEIAALFDAHRFIGPVFDKTVIRAHGAVPVDIPLCPGGFGAFEAEFIAVVGEDTDPVRNDWTTLEAATLITQMHIGVEVAGSPLACVNDLGALASISAFGNNAGMVIAEVIEGWRDLTPAQMRCTTIIDSLAIASNSAETLPGDIFAAVAFALNRASSMGQPLRRGQYILTGAITGVHPVAAGQRCKADFGDLGAIECIVIPGRST